MDGLILRRMRMYLRYGGTDGEDEDAGNEKGHNISVHSKLCHSNRCIQKMQKA